MGLMRHPAVVLGIVWMALAVAAPLRARVSWWNPANRRGALIVASLTALIVYSAIVVWYTFESSYFDPAEPTITAVAAVFRAGKPLYPALDAPERYAHIYGPVLFIVQAGAFALAGASIFVSKAVGSVAALASLAIVYIVYQRRAGAVAALHVTALIALVDLYFNNVTFWTRSDPLLILCTAIGLAGAHVQRSLPASIVLGMAAGAAINLKITGAIYLVPVFAIALSRHRAGVLWAATGIALLAASTPFLLPHVSLSNYLGYLQLSARNGLLPAKLLENAEWVLVLLAPLAVACRGMGTARLEPDARRFLTCLVVAVGTIGFAAAKPGGGSFHFLPFLPLLGYAALTVPRGAWNEIAATRVALAFAIMAFAIALPRQAIFVRTVADRHLEQAIADLDRFADRTPLKRAAVGYAGVSYLSQARPQLVFRTSDYLIDAPAVQEHRLSGLDIPASTIRAIDDCRFDYWLLPQEAPPFTVPNAYQPLGPPDVFPDQFRSAFSRRYVRVGHTALFDVWECRRQSGGAAN
jgi:dolichyl-phosphate-mannose-protein mannosyltransferase